MLARGNRVSVTVRPRKSHRPVSTILNSRRQLTLFATEPWRSRLNELRRLLDPVQASLISAHVTLCREDEIEYLETDSIVRRIKSWAHGPLILAFGLPRRFSGHGVLLPCERGSDQFHSLRQWLLQRQDVRAHEAHLTLAHPRNPPSAGNTEASLQSCPPALQLQFPSVALIEQQGSADWRVIAESTLGSGASGSFGLRAVGTH